jgi:membrane-associated phospholipid phosphatase
MKNENGNTYHESDKGEKRMETRTEIYEKKQENYKKRMDYLAKTPVLTRFLHIVNKILTFTVFLLYPLLLTWLLLNHKEYLLRAILVPFVSFVLVTVVRRLINRARPYEAYGIPSAVYKSTSGKSFPSRHVFSIFVIAVTFLYLGPDPMIGLALFAAGVILGLIRILIGVHYVSDVVVGAFVGILAGFIGFGLIY